MDARVQSFSGLETLHQDEEIHKHFRRTLGMPRRVAVEGGWRGVARRVEYLHVMASEVELATVAALTLPRTACLLSLLPFTPSWLLRRTEKISQ